MEVHQIFYNFYFTCPNCILSEKFETTLNFSSGVQYQDLIWCTISWSHMVYNIMWCILSNKIWQFGCLKTISSNCGLYINQLNVYSTNLVFKESSHKGFVVKFFKLLNIFTPYLWMFTVLFNAEWNKTFIPRMLILILISWTFTVNFNKYLNWIVDIFVQHQNNCKFNVLDKK